VAYIRCGLSLPVEETPAYQDFLVKLAADPSLHHRFTPEVMALLNPEVLVRERVWGRGGERETEKREGGGGGGQGESARERERERAREPARERERVGVCVCARLCRSCLPEMVDSNRTLSHPPSLSPSPLTLLLLTLPLPSSRPPFTTNNYHISLTFHLTTHPPPTPTHPTDPVLYSSSGRSRSSTC
jgi:hypothetical protein